MTEASHPFLIGVDGGGTRCRAAIGTLSSGVIARGDAGPANATSDLAQAIENVEAAVRCAAQSAGISDAQLRAATAHIAIAGVMSPSDSARVAAALPFGKITVTDDRPSTLKGALGDFHGFVLAIGTGAFTAASTPDGIQYVGGWGMQVSDHGSGAWLGRGALERALLCYDGVLEHSDLTRALMLTFGGDPNGIVAFATTATPADYASLAPDVITQAQAGDVLARAIMQAGADHLSAGLGALGFKSGDRLCLTGGVGPHYAPFLPGGYLKGRIEPQGSALDGAFALAKTGAPR